MISNSRFDSFSQELIKGKRIDLSGKNQYNYYDEAVAYQLNQEFGHRRKE
jgi:hypothetical protein